MVNIFIQVFEYLQPTIPFVALGLILLVIINYKKKS